MKMEQLKPGDRVFDPWWPWRVGEVQETSETQAKILFGTELWTYDRAHAQFLRRYQP